MTVQSEPRYELAPQLTAPLHRFLDITAFSSRSIKELSTRSAAFSVAKRGLILNRASIMFGTPATGTLGTLVFAWISKVVSYMT